MRIQSVLVNLFPNYKIRTKMCSFMQESATVWCRKVQLNEDFKYHSMFADKLKKVYTISENGSMVIEDIHIRNVKIESDGKKHVHKLKEI